MGRAPLAAFLAVLCIAAVPVVAYLTKTREVIVSTPSAYTGLTVPLPLPAGSQACVDSILFATEARFVRFGATAHAPSAAPAIEVTADADNNGPYAARARVEGGWRGERQLDVALTPPRADTLGLLCIRNLGDAQIDLVGSEDGRAYSRPSVKIDGEPTPIELQVRLMAAGRHSLLARIGDMTAHGSTLKPLGAWWLWLLALALLTLVPLGLLTAVRSALDEDASRAERPAPRLLWQDAAFRRRAAAVEGWAIVGAVAVVVVLWLAYWSLSTNVFQNDEDQYVYLSRWLQTDFPASLFDFAAYGRGLQRLEVWLLAIPAALFDAPLSLQLGRLLNVVAFVSTAIPIYKLARGLGLSSRWAALPASVSVVVPWAVVTTGFLTENIAYPACLWALWAIWRTAAEPSAGRDVLALVLIVVAAATRSAMLLLVPVLPLVVAGTGLRCAAGPLTARVRSVLRDHAVLWAAVGLGALVLVLSALGVGGEGIGRRLAGGYQTQLGFDVGHLLDKSGRYVSKAVIGTGFFPAVIALPWLALVLGGSRDPRRFGFALLVVVSALALLYSLNTAGPDERYILYLAPLILLPATLALAEGAIPPIGLGVASALLALLVLVVPWNPDQGPFAFFVVPVEMFYSRGIGLRLTRYLPGDGSDALLLAGLALGAAGVVLAVLLRRAPGRLAGTPAIALVVAVVAIVPIQTAYALSRYVNGAGSKSAPSVSARAFVDRLVPGGATAGEFVEGVGQNPSFFPIWQEVQFYNQRLDRVYALGENVNPVPPGDGLVAGVSYDPRTGRIRSSAPLPDYLVTPTQVGEVRVRGTLVTAPSYVPVALWRIAKPATLDWSANGFDAIGSVPAGATGKVRFYGTGLPAGTRCANYVLLAPPERPLRYRFRSGDDVLGTGTLNPGETRNVKVRLERLAERGYADVRLTGTAVRAAGISLGAC